MPRKRKLRLKFHGRVIDHLGIQMYQSPVAAIAELVANAWDADAENVWITLPRQLDRNAEIVIKDDGIGMTFKECEDKYLNVGWNRRSDNPDEVSREKQRPILGRKGIGKFAGFGIAQVIHVETISKDSGEKTDFELNLQKLRGEQYVSSAGTEIDADYLEPNSTRKKTRATIVALRSLRLGRRPSPRQFGKSMARRFLLHQQQADFKVFVDGEPLPDALGLAGVQYVFPRDYEEGDKPETILEIDTDGWGIETLHGRRIRWRFLFHKDTIDEEELRGVAVFAKGKMAQSPFLFNLVGGLGGQHAVEYLSGQVEADYLDSLADDLISTERQRIDWNHRESQPLLEWGQIRVKELLRVWRDRRGAERIQNLEEKVSGFSWRLEKLQPHEVRTVKRALAKLAQIPTLTQSQFEDLGDAVLTAWEQGRLRVLIGAISEAEELTEQELLDILLEAQVLTDLNVAEAIKTKILTVGGLKVRIQKRELEAAVRDYIAKNPWLISPQWETFRVERSVRQLLDDSAAKAGMTGERWAGRVDLALASAHNLLVLEFMRPGLRIDWDHLNRFDRYVRTLRASVSANTAGPFRTVAGYIVADELEKDAAILDKIKAMSGEDMYALDWHTLFANALRAWQEFLEILATRTPSDERLRVLIEEPPAKGAARQS